MSYTLFTYPHGESLAVGLAATERILETWDEDSGLCIHVEGETFLDATIVADYDHIDDARRHFSRIDLKPKKPRKKKETSA